MNRVGLVLTYWFSKQMDINSIFLRVILLFKKCDASIIPTRTTVPVGWDPRPLDTFFTPVQPTTLSQARRGRRGGGAELRGKLWSCRQNLEKTQDFVRASGPQI